MEKMQSGTAAVVGSLGKKLKLWVAALAWVAGLLLAGSEGPWMPYANCGGGLVFLGATIWLGRVLPGGESGAEATAKEGRWTKDAGMGHMNRRSSSSVPQMEHVIGPQFARTSGRLVNTGY